MPELFCLGLGYSALTLARRLAARDWRISGTSRSQERVTALEEEGFDAFLYDGTARSADVSNALARASHLLLSAPPLDSGDPLLVRHRDDLEASKTLKWIGYLSTVGVYGNHDGAWIGEDAPLKATQARGRRRADTERAWLDFGRSSGKAVHVFRLAGIYGPGRNAVENVRKGKARRIIKPGQVFNRIHVEDIANTLEASIASPDPGAIYNVCDDEPAPPQDLVSYAAKLLGVDPPPEMPFDEADLTPMARSFYGENKRISNARIKRELGVTLAYPTYRQGLEAIAAQS